MCGEANISVLRPLLARFWKRNCSERQQDSGGSQSWHPSPRPLQSSQTSGSSGLKSLRHQHRGVQQHGGLATADRTRQHQRASFQQLPHLLGNALVAGRASRRHARTPASPATCNVYGDAAQPAVAYREARLVRRPLDVHGALLLPLEPGHERTQDR